MGVIAHPLSSEQQQQSPCNNFSRTLARISLRSSKYSTPLACTSYGLTSIHMIQKQSLTFIFFKICLRIFKDQKGYGKKKIKTKRGILNHSLYPRTYPHCASICDHL